jgi:hypothetical protein
VIDGLKTLRELRNQLGNLGQWIALLRLNLACHLLDRAPF